MALTAIRERRRKKAGRAAYLAALRSAIAALWAGAIDAGQFTTAMFAAIRRYLTAAWVEGAEEAGLAFDELTAEELMELERLIVSEFGYVGRLAGAVAAEDEHSGAELEPHLARAELWAGRYDETRNLALTLAAKDERLEWVVSPRKQHCHDCLRLSGTDINALCVLVTKINFALFAPWHCIPSSFFPDDQPSLITHGNTLLDAPPAPEKGQLSLF